MSAVLSKLAALFADAREVEPRPRSLVRRGEQGPGRAREDRHEPILARERRQESGFAGALSGNGQIRPEGPSGP